MSWRNAAITTVLATASLRCALLTDLGDYSSGNTGAPADAGPSADSSSPDSPAPTPEVDAGKGALGPLWLAYGTTGGSVKVRRWDDAAAAWSTELAGPDVEGGLVRWVVPKETPSGSFLAVVSGEPNTSLRVFERTADGTWKLGFSTPMAVKSRRAFDLDYETSTGSVVVVYGDATATPKFRRRTAAGWSAEQSGNALGTLPPQWIELARNPLRNELALVLADNGSNLGVSLWNGASWTDVREVEAYLNSADYKCFDAAYDAANGGLLVAWGRTMPTDGGRLEDMRYLLHPTDGDFGAVSSANVGLPPGPIVLAPEPGTSRIALSYVEHNCNKGDDPCDDFVGAVWGGSSFVSNKSLDPDTTTLYQSRPGTMVTSVAWLGNSGVALAAYHRALAEPGQLAFSRFGAGAWGSVTGAASGPSLPPRASMQLVSASGPSVVALVEDVTGTLWSTAYSETGGGGTWRDVSPGGPLATALTPLGGVPFGATTP